jgi:hypothetical protein
MLFLGAKDLLMTQGFTRNNISLTGDSGGTLNGSSFTITGGTTGLTFAGSGSTETLGGTLVIANGGTNATSMATSTGIVKYDGTRLVTSSTAKIDSSNRMTNSSQPAFYAYLAATVANVTGDGSAFDYGTTTALTEVFDQGGDFNTNGTFTAPVTGLYFFFGNTAIDDLGAAHTDGYNYFTAGGNVIIGTRFQANTVSNVTKTTSWGISLLVSLTAAQTCKLGVVVNNSTKTVDAHGGNLASSYYSYFGGYLVC